MADLAGAVLVALLVALAGHVSPVSAAGLGDGGTDIVDASFVDLKGHNHKLSDYRGQWIVVNYWATWCEPCRDEVPLLNTVHAEYANAVVLGVNYESASLAHIERFIREFQVNYPVIDSQMAPRYALGPIYGLPATFFITPEGELAAGVFGALQMSMVDEMIGGDGPTLQEPVEHHHHHGHLP